MEVERAATVNAMLGDYAAVYREHIVRVLAEREERLWKADFRAAAYRPDDLAANVGPGWRSLVLRLREDMVTLDPDCRLYSIEQRFGILRVRASFTGGYRGGDGRQLIGRAAGASTHVCEVCGDDGRVREERGPMVTLCDACWNADRALAAERGGRYANLLLLQLLSGDPAHPGPEELAAYMDRDFD